VTPSNASKLLARIGSGTKRIEVRTSPAGIEPYLHDEAVRSSDPAAAVLFPRSTEEVSRILKLASRFRVPVVPRGAGSGVAGSAVPGKGWIVLSLERMNRILAVDERDAVAVVEPGAITGEIRKAVEAKGLFYPPVPGSVDLCTIGGNVATNAGGLSAVKYGVTRPYVLGLEAVLAGGEVIQTGGRYLKHSTGYDLTQLIVGSEGTLAVITKIVLRLLPLPTERMTLLAPFPSLEDLTGAVLAILAERIVPPTLELVPRGAVRSVLARNPDISFPFPESEASLLIEVDGADLPSVERDVARLAPILERCGSPDPLVAFSPSQRERLWSLRKGIRDSIVACGPYVEADSVVPRSQLPELVRAGDACGARHGLETISYGHAGDGNLHTYFLKGTLLERSWKSASKKVLREYYERTVRLGGTISGEHGIGSLKRPYLPIALSGGEIQLMRGIKKAFDPYNLLNPGKLLP
jgi:glycolate oxidase